jgi:hypothetical protein
MPFTVNSFEDGLKCPLLISCWFLSFSKGVPLTTRTAADLGSSRFLLWAKTARTKMAKACV